jgi:hypothetical protein
MTGQSRQRITIDAPDGSTILAARHLDANEGRVQIGSTVDTAARSAITTVLRYIAKAHNAQRVAMDVLDDGPRTRVRNEIARIAKLPVVANNSDRADSFDCGARWTIRMIRTALDEPAPVSGPARQRPKRPNPTHVAPTSRPPSPRTAACAPAAACRTGSTAASPPRPDSASRSPPPCSAPSGSTARCRPPTRSASSTNSLTRCWP